jgi:hypothetical protein
MTPVCSSQHRSWWTRAPRARLQRRASSRRTLRRTRPPSLVATSQRRQARRRLLPGATHRHSPAPTLPQPVHRRQRLVATTRLRLPRLARTRRHLRHPGRGSASFEQQRAPRSRGSFIWSGRAVYAAVKAISRSDGLMISVASVTACTSSAVQPGAASSSTRPSGVTPITATSVNIFLTRPAAVSG